MCWRCVAANWSEGKREETREGGRKECSQRKGGVAKSRRRPILIDEGQTEVNASDASDGQDGSRKLEMILFSTLGDADSFSLLNTFLLTTRFFLSERLSGSD